MVTNYNLKYDKYIIVAGGSTEINTGSTAIDIYKSTASGLEK